MKIPIILHVSPDKHLSEIQYDHTHNLWYTVSGNNEFIEIYDVYTVLVRKLLMIYLSVCNTFISKSIPCVPTSRRNF